VKVRTRFGAGVVAVAVLGSFDDVGVMVGVRVLVEVAIGMDVDV
jgi:hypothetical protein